MQRTPLFLLAAAVLSLVALVGRPGVPAPAGPVRVSMLAPPQLPPGAGGLGPLGVPGSGLTVSMVSSHSTALAHDGTLFAEVRVTAASDLRADAPGPVSMVIVLDRSGSMSGTKIEHARAAAQRLISSMGDEDQLAVVTFGSVVESSPALHLDRLGRQQLSLFVSRVVADGATNLSSGLEEASRLVRTMPGSRRLVLISDGQPTAGDTSAEGLQRLVASVHAGGVSVTALGVGYDFDSRLLSNLAELGGGLTGSLDDAARLTDVLELELRQARAVAARRVSVTLRPGPGVTLVNVPGRFPACKRDRSEVPLRDLRPGDSEVVYAQLRTDALADAQALLLTATVEWTTAAGGREASAGTLTLPVVAAQEEFDASRVEVRFAAGVRALGSTKMVAAAEALERGDNEGAVSMLQAARNIFGMSADALAGESENTRQMEARARNVKGDSARAEAHMLEKKAMVNFSRENDGY